MKNFSRSFLAASSLFLSLMLGAPAAHAQLDHLNVDRLIKDMRERGMSELLVRLSKDGSIKDPADAKKIEVEMLILRAQTPVPSNENDLKERIASLEKGIAEFQALINGNRDNDKRPLWQADMALHLVYTRMSLNDLADDFYEFGMPTAGQTQTFESGASLSVESLIDASTFLGRLQRELPRAANYNQTDVNTGRWEEMMDEYLKTKVPFLLAQSAYWATLLPDSHPYFKHLGQNPNVPLQATTPAAERTRLLNLAIDSLAGIPTDLSVKFGLPARPSNLIKGKALARLGRFDEAMTAFDLVAQQTKDDLLAFRAGLARAVAMELKAKKPDAAVEYLETLRDHPAAQGGVAFPILITDLQHRLLAKHAGTDKKKIEAAYVPYDKLFGDKRLGPLTETARLFVFTRWTKQYGDQKQDTLPPMVLSGMAEMERLIGNDLVAGWASFLRDQKEDQAKAAMTEARTHLDKCIAICKALIERADVPAEVKARARYNKAYAAYLRDPESGQAFLDAAAIWTELASELPTHPLAEEAIGLAVRFLHNLHIQEPRPQGVDAAYRSTTAVLYTKLATTQLADDERVYYTFNVLQSELKYQEAAESYAKVPQQHRDYYEAQREMIFCQVQLWNGMAEGTEKAAKRDVLRDEVTRVERAIRKALEEGGDPRRVQIFKNTLADLVLNKVMFDMHRKAWDEADKVLRNFAADFPEDQDLIRTAISRRIMVKVKQGDSNEAVKLANELVASAGDDKAKQAAAAGTIDAALAELADDIDDLRAASESSKGEIDKREFLERATAQAKASEQLADMLLKWALDNGAEQDQLFRYRLIKARSSIMTGNLSAATTVLSDLARAFPGEARVQFLEGEVLFVSGTTNNKPAELIKAIGIFNKITSDEAMRAVKLTADMKPVDRAARDILNRVWWQAWLRIFQCYDKLGKNTADIPRVVTQLELQYPELGGPGMRTKLVQLANKYRK